MALEVSAAIIGILAAAGKVAETLGPLVSAFVQAPKHAQTILTEIKHTETILLGLDALFGDLNTSPRQRRNFIRLDQLIAAFTDGVLLFSELEALVSQLGKDLKGSTRSRTRWAKHKSELDTVLSRLVSFKVSIDLMLNILRCDSDVDAQRDRDELLTMTSTLLAHNLDLARRIARLEGQDQDGGSVVTYRPSSPTSVMTVTHSSENIRPEHNSKTFTQILMSASQKAHYEHELEASRVYRKAQRDIDDITSRRSIALSHAWSALSEVSLAAISAISVLGLPLYLDEISNAYHYFPKPPIDTAEGFAIDATQAFDRSFQLDSTVAPAALPARAPIRGYNYLSANHPWPFSTSQQVTKKDLRPIKLPPLNLLPLGTTMNSRFSPFLEPPAEVDEMIEVTEMI
ncbi:hypothetical protein CC86DRAFT_457249 [Ophiobolus disseminans]|uniref:Fungal N-terminal domain-containing protein n=1 Tax=Ophiobolus disseminans TaxID=1469910 RepID=A0A6A6ZUJ5_9PLEO|nr:hypothetical protein CC86DRAFT_457249 [Ophiobolus disseminans]